MSIWIFFIINIVASVWNSYAAGILWESDDGLLNRILAGTVLVAAFVGYTYAFILAAIGLGYVGIEYLLSANVILGIPSIATGLMITGHSWVQLIKNRSIIGFLVTMWNTFATFWNIYVWIRSFKQVGGFAEAATNLTGSRDARIVTVVSVVASSLLTYVLFQQGRKAA